MQGSDFEESAFLTRKEKWPMFAGFLFLRYRNGEISWEKAHVWQAKSRMSQLVDNVKILDVRLLISICGSVPDRQYEETRLPYEKAKISHICGPFSLQGKSKRVAWSEDGACLRGGWLRTMAWPCGEKERLIFQGGSFCGCIGWR